MEANKGSITALISAFGRGYHATHVEPKIFDDFLAFQLLTEEERTSMRMNLARALQFFDPESAAACPDQETALAMFLRDQSTPITLSRAQYTEDVLEEAVARGIKQYVILGAGLDTFAYRRPDLMKQLRVFEIDHPETQAMKKQRTAQAGWEQPANLHYVPVDFNQENLVSKLEQSEYNPNVASFFSWLGVSYYLTRDVVLQTLKSVASLAPSGSMIVFDYLEEAAFAPETVALRVKRMQIAAATAGEPMKTGFEPSALADELAGIGLRLQANLSPEEIETCYFACRTDGYHAFEQIHFACAVVE